MKLLFWIVLIIAVVQYTSGLSIGSKQRRLTLGSSKLDGISPMMISGGATKYRSKGIVSYISNFMQRLRKLFAKKSTRHSVKTSTGGKDGSLARIQKEMQEFLDNPPANCKLSYVYKSNIRKWDITLTGCEGTVYAGEEYKLRIEFSKQYPAKAPSVYFLKPSPKHVHVYSNGDICLNILGKDWRPTMTVQTIAVSILSMLSSAKSKGMPLDNASHSDMEPGKQAEYLYHDEKC